MNPMGQTLVLNASYEPINIVPDTRAIVLILNGKAVSVLDTDRLCSGGQATFLFPSVIRLVTMADVPRVRTVPLSRRALFQRDGFRCQYCGERPDKLEVEHVFPRSRGGRNRWENVVAACRACNAHKRDRTPEEAGMKLLTKPYAPTRLAQLARKGNPEWAPYLGEVDE